MSETDLAPDPTVPKRSIWPLVAVAIVAALATAGLAYLISNISDRKAEGGGITQYTRVEAINADTYDPAVWGKTYSAQYDGYLKTKQITPTHHVAEWVPITDEERKTKDAGLAPDAEPVRFPDAREANTGDAAKVTPSKLGEDPRLKVLWNGYAFAKDYRHLRGHEWMLTDQQQTLRVLALVNRPAEKGGPQPGACANCHASIPYIVDQLGDPDANTVGTGLNMDGWAKMNKAAYTDLADNDKLKDMGPIGCIDCHNPETMELRISRPALVEGIADLKNAERVAAGQPVDLTWDVNRNASTQEMRTYVCAQCHVEYYFAPPDKTLTFPWDNGSDINDVWTYYAELELPDGSVGFTDFTHADTGAGVVKAQHPEFESWSQGVHATNGVACADCHMPYVVEGGKKVSNHHIASPMADPGASCGTCHPGSTAKLESRVTSIQNTFKDSRNRTMDAVVSLIVDIGAAKDDPALADRVALAQQYQNFANFYVDYAYSENSYGFHAPDYFQRILSQSMNAAREGQRALLGVDPAKLVPVNELNRDWSVPKVEAPAEEDEG
ncbi:MAG: ammonia-forming cytochrome c nitrite reductase subunit c552 [Micrococcales bacterium]|nr:ammonia-forming cytochrome c nitrite reductase subunit c552 [Micrococcales bacterium]